jgi:hypothetical protein
MGSDDSSHHQDGACATVFALPFFDFMFISTAGRVDATQIFVKGIEKEKPRKLLMFCKDSETEGKRPEASFPPCSERFVPRYARLI